MVPTADETAVQKSLEELLNDPELQDKPSKAARERVRRIDAALILERFETLVMQILTERNPIQAG